MNNSLKRFLLTAVSCLTITLVSAQGTAEDAARTKATQTTSELKTLLNLSHEQQTAVMEVLTYTELKRATYTGNDGGRIDTYLNTELNRILTASQMSVYLRNEAIKHPKSYPSEGTNEEHKE